MILVTYLQDEKAQERASAVLFPKKDQKHKEGQLQLQEMHEKLLRLEKSQKKQTSEKLETEKSLETLQKKAKEEKVELETKLDGLESENESYRKERLQLQEKIDKLEKVENEYKAKTQKQENEDAKKTSSIRKVDPYPKWVQESQKTDESDGIIAKHKVLFDTIYEKHRSMLGFSAKGREKVVDIIRNLAANRTAATPVTVMEIGVWFGDSLIAWLTAAPTVRVIGIDPFRAPYKDHYKVPTSLPDEDANHFGEPTFNRALAQYHVDKRVPKSRDRTLIVTGKYPEAGEKFLKQPEDSNFGVDVFYIDGGKTNDPDFVCKFTTNNIHQFLLVYPTAILAGDDWDSKVTANAFPTTVKTLALVHERELYVVQGHTWLMIPKKSNIDMSGAEKLL